MENFGKYWNSLGALATIAARHLPEQIDAICEYGPGYSTFLLNIVAVLKGARVLSIVEQYPPYMARLEASLPNDGPARPMLAELFNEDRLRSESADSLYYATAPLSVGRPYDLSIIDGRTRIECLLVSALASTPGALVILDDSDRIRYAPGLMLFEEVDHQIRYRILRPRREVAALRERFCSELGRFSERLVVRPRDDRKGGMGHVPGLDPLSGQEAAVLADLAGAYAMVGDGTVLCWGAADAVAAVAAPLAGTRHERFHVGDKRTGQVRTAGWVSVAASLTGSLADMSRDPNMNYGTAPLALKRKFGVMVVAGQRRNECLLTAAFVLAPGGVVILRDADCLHFRPGLALYDVVEAREGFSVLRVSADMARLVTATSPVLEERTAGAAITEA